MEASGMNDVANEEGFIVAYPDGVENSWNGAVQVLDTPAAERDLDDVGFLSALIDQLSSEFSIDPSGVYATGISNGGQMAYRLAEDLGERIAPLQ
jgi:polyhydroxybutyrate depolymerase